MGFSGWGTPWGGEDESGFAGRTVGTRGLGPVDGMNLGQPGRSGRGCVGTGLSGSGTGGGGGQSGTPSSLFQQPRLPGSCHLPILQFPPLSLPIPQLPETGTELYFNNFLFSCTAFRGHWAKFKSGRTWGDGAHSAPRGGSGLHSGAASPRSTGWGAFVSDSPELGISYLNPSGSPEA